MSWADCGVDSRGRPVGYVHMGECDHPGCRTRVCRGLYHACGGMHGTVEEGCEGYFCSKHLYFCHREDRYVQLCESCLSPTS
jgi:hypothetical protein